MEYYEIVIQGHLGDRWQEWFHKLELTRLPEGDSLLSGNIKDQAQLHGILNDIRDLGLVLKKITKG